MRWVAAGAGLLLAASTWAGALPTVTATVSKTDVSVGESFTIEVRASGPPGCGFAFPSDLGQETFEMETAPPAPGQSPGAPPTGVHRYQAAVFALGEAQVPPITVRYRLADGSGGELRTTAIPLQVHSLLPKEKDEQKLADVRAPLRLSIGRWFWIGLAALGMLAAGLAAWLATRRRGAAPGIAAAVPAIAADEEARRALEALAASERLARGEYRVFYIELTAIAKRYLERRLGAPIVEMTTTEMLNHLRATSHTAELGPVLRDLSGAADQIKFARGAGAAEEAGRHMAAVRALIDGLEARLKPAEPESGRAA
jgi:hypothetical protein